MDVKTPQPYRIRQTNQALKTSEIWGFSDADEAIEYVKDYIAYNASDLFFGGVTLTTIYDGVSEKNMMRNVIFEVPKVLTMSHLGFKYDPTFEHEDLPAKDMARDILRLMEKGDLKINTENPLAWRLTYNLNSQIIILFDFPYLFRVKPSFSKIESLERQLQGKDAKIDILKRELTDLKINYMDVLKTVNSYIDVVECPPCVYITNGICKYDCEKCETCGKRHLNCKGCDYHFECQNCKGRCCNTCGGKCPKCKGYTCYSCNIVCMKCNPPFSLKFSLESLG